MKPEIASEHSLVGEAQIDGEWYPCVAHCRFNGITWRLQIFVYLDSGKVDYYDDLEAYDFETSLLDLLAPAGVEDQSPGAVWRYSTHIRRETESNVEIVKATFEVGLRKVDQSKQLVPFATCQIDSEEPVSVSPDLLAAVESTPGLQCCGKCRLSQFSCYGGNNLFFGLSCFRDNPEKVDDQIFLREIEDWREYAYSNVSSLHWCPQFQPRARNHE